MNKEFTVNACCIYCGSEQFDMDSKDDTTICCGKCGKKNSLITLREQAIQKGKERAVQELQDKIGKIFKNKTIKLKL